jgi:surface carbohydrate biosynthesis protein
MESDTIELINLSTYSKIKTFKHMEDYYFKRGYVVYKKNIKFYIFKKIRKFKTLLKLFFLSKLHFCNPKKKDFIVYDCENTKDIIKILPNNNYKILSTRIERIKEIYFSKKIFSFIILNFFKRSLKQNYLAALIQVISPKIVITHIDNSADFYLSAKIFKNEIKFIAVQNANRGDIVYESLEENKKVFVPVFLCFGSFDEEIYRKKKCNIEKFEIVGSLRSSLATECVKTKGINLNKEKYDICLISEPHPILNSDYHHISNLADSVAKIAEYTHRLCKKKNLNLIFTSKREDDLDSCFYKKYLQEYEFNILPGSYEVYSTYQNVMQSKLIIGHISTILREAISFNKKILSCNFTGHPDIIFPTKGFCVLENVPYELFEERVLKILSMSEKEYFDRLNLDKNYIMKPTTNTANIIREKLSFLLKEKNNYI